MNKILLKLKNAYLYAYYECYLQEHSFYKDHRNKNFYAITTLGVVLIFLLEFPILMIFDKTIGLPQKKYLYPSIIGVACFQLFLTSQFVGDDDLTDQINSFYENKKVVKESRMIVWGFVLLCIAFWTFVIMYNG